MITNQEYRNALEIVMLYRKQCMGIIAEIDRNTDKYFDIRNTKIEDTEISVRARTILFHTGFKLNYFDSLVKDLANISRSELMKRRNLGKKTFAEIEALCQQANIEMLA
jgi:DNA-directed RNA polymerase alpha subunit